MRRKRMTRIAAGIAGLLFILAQGMLLAQVTAASLSGRITDPSGAAVPGASLILTAGERQWKTTTDLEGRYRFENLAPGRYDLRAEAAGFAPFEVLELEITGARELEIPLVLEVTKTEVTVSDAPRLELDPASNASSLGLKGQDLDALSENPDDLQAELQALAGPAAGPGGGEIFVDGFSGGRLPPKSAIREIRINRNPFSAEYDRPGFGRIEIFTRPGSGAFHGQAFFNFGDSRLNARNPFAPSKPGSQMRMLNFGLSGPLGKRASFSLDADRHSSQGESVVSAAVLDAGWNVTRFSEAVISPVTRTLISPRLDMQLNRAHTLSVRYFENRLGRDNWGIGQLTLPSRALNSSDSDHMVQVTETAVLGASAVNEVRAQLIRRSATQTPVSFDPAISVQGAFEAGGSPSGLSRDRQTRWELHDVATITRGKHLVKFGGRLRGVALEQYGTQDYNGTFVFPSLDAYRVTLMGLAGGLPWAGIRALGGGPSLFTLAAGNPLARLRQADAGLFVEDDWRVRQNFSLSLGLRYETQNNIPDHLDLAPRAGFAWGLGRQPTTVIRGGFGLFYDRVAESLVLDALRLNGINQQQYLVRWPDFFPQAPDAGSLAAARLPTAVRTMDAALRTPYMAQAAIGVERQLPRNVFASVTYTATRGVHMLRSRNMNAPVDGVRPHAGGDIYVYESTGGFRQHQLITNVNARVSPKLTLFGFYALGRARSDTDGAASFPANSWDLASEWGRAAFDVRHRVFLGGSITAPFGLRLSPFLTASSGAPFNITLGRDLNGDSIYNDRPAFATDLSRASVVYTRWGVFDTDPLPGQTVIPRNWGSGPGQFSLNLRMSRTFGFGGERKSPAPGMPEAMPPGGGPPPGASGGPGVGPGAPAGMRGGPRGPFAENSSSHYSLTLAISAHNLLNHVNVAPPIGILASPLFGTSNGLAGGMGPGAAANRRVEIQLRLSF